MTSSSLFFFFFWSLLQACGYIYIACLRNSLESFDKCACMMAAERSPISSAAGGRGMSETRSPVPLLYRRRSSGEIMRNMASVSSSLLPAFGTVVGDGSPVLHSYIIAPYDRRYRSFLLLYSPLHVISFFQLIITTN